MPADVVLSGKATADQGIWPNLDPLWTFRLVRGRGPGMVREELSFRFTARTHPDETISGPGCAPASVYWLSPLAPTGSDKTSKHVFRDWFSFFLSIKSNRS